MTDYNFAKNYENIKSWEFKKQDNLKPAPENFLEELTTLIKNYPKLFLFLKSHLIDLKLLNLLKQSQLQIKSQLFVLGI